VSLKHIVLIFKQHLFFLLANCQYILGEFLRWIAYFFVLITTVKDRLIGKKINFEEISCRNFREILTLILYIMKKYLFTFAAILACSFFASAQESEKKDADAQDKIQQEPPKPIQRQVERASKQAAVRETNNKKVNEAQAIKKNTPKPKTKLIDEKSATPLNK
jgi:hypothetical protein